MPRRCANISSASTTFSDSTRHCALPGFGDISRDVVEAVLEQSSRFATQTLLPLNRPADEQGCRLAEGVVTTPEGFKSAYRKLVEGGWPALTCAAAHGGQGFPHMINVLFEEMMNAACLSFGLFPGLGRGAYVAIARHGSPEQAALYAPKARERRLGRLHVPDRGTGRHRSRPAADAGGAAARRQLCHNRNQDLHLLRRARPHGQHRVSRAGKTPRRARGHQGHQPVPRSQVHSGCRSAIPGARNGVSCGAIEHKMGSTDRPPA